MSTKNKQYDGEETDNEEEEVDLLLDCPKTSSRTSGSRKMPGRPAKKPLKRHVSLDADKPKRRPGGKDGMDGSTGRSERPKRRPCKIFVDKSDKSKQRPKCLSKSTRENPMMDGSSGKRRSVRRCVSRDTYDDDVVPDFNWAEERAKRIAALRDSVPGKPLEKRKSSRKMDKSASSSSSTSTRKMDSMKSFKKSPTKEPQRQSVYSADNPFFQILQTQGAVMEAAALSSDDDDEAPKPKKRSSKGKDSKLRSSSAASSSSDSSSCSSSSDEKPVKTKKSPKVKKSKSARQVRSSATKREEREAMFFSTVAA